jgi:uncharacterized membrane protein
MSKIITGLFDSSTAAREVLYKLEGMGFSPAQINIVSADDKIGHSLSIDKETKASEGGLIGATTGGLIGAIVAGLAATGSIVIPGVNLIVFGTAIAAAAGAGLGAATGGLAGALIGLGLPEYEVKYYEDKVKEGSTLIAVEAENDDRAAVVKDIFETQKAHRVAA